MVEDEEHFCVDCPGLKEKKRYILDTSHHEATECMKVCTAMKYVTINLWRIR